MLPLFSCHSSFDIPCCQSLKSGFTIIYNVYTLIREQRSEGLPPRCLHLPSNYIASYLLLHVKSVRISFLYLRPFCICQLQSISYRSFPLYHLIGNLPDMFDLVQLLIQPYMHSTTTYINIIIIIILCYT